MTIADIVLRHSQRGMNLLKELLSDNMYEEAAAKLLQLKKGTILLATGFYVAGFAETDGVRAAFESVTNPILLLLIGVTAASPWLPAPALALLPFAGWLALLIAVVRLARARAAWLEGRWRWLFIARACIFWR